MKGKALKSQPSFETVNAETRAKVEIAKKYIEQKYQKNFEEERRRKQYYNEIIAKMQNLERTKTSGRSSRTSSSKTR